MDSNVGIIILAAGMGKRMKSDKAKVLHEIAGRPMIDYVVDTAVKVAGANVVVVVGYQADQVREVVGRSHQVHFAFQPEQKGTGHAVACALPHISETVTSVVVLCGDVPLMRPETIEQMITEHHAHQRDVTILAVRMPDPTGYGRVVLDADGRLISIVEQADASDAQKAIDIINAGVYVIDKLFLTFALPLLGSNNAQGEIYLTDIVEQGHRNERNIGAMIGANPNEILGVNSQSELHAAEKIINIVSYEKS